jgi:hypothetical protein
VTRIEFQYEGQKNHTHSLIYIGGSGIQMDARPLSCVGNPSAPLQSSYRYGSSSPPLVLPLVGVDIAELMYVQHFDNIIGLDRIDITLPRRTSPSSVPPRLMVILVAFNLH